MAEKLALNIFLLKRDRVAAFEEMLVAGHTTIPLPPLDEQRALYWTRANMDSIESRASGTTFQEISKSNSRSMPFAVPPDNVMRAFTERVEPLHRTIVANIRQSRILAGIRDALLPKLMSGEIRSIEANEFRGEALS